MGNGEEAPVLSSAGVAGVQEQRDAAFEGLFGLDALAILSVLDVAPEGDETIRAADVGVARFALDFPDVRTEREREPSVEGAHY